MNVITKIDEHIVYENPLPHLVSRQAKFPGLVQLNSGELIALFEIGEAFESVDSHTFISRSNDNGRTWQLQGELYDMAELGLGYPVSECLKPALLKDGTLIATGYRFHREYADRAIGNPETGGLLPGDDVISFSNDDGRTWSLPKVIEHGYREVLELSGPCIELSCGDIIAAGCPFKMWDGSNPTGQKGVLLRSKDKGVSWEVDVDFFVSSSNSITPWESRLCEMQPGRIVSIVWVFDMAKNEHLPNHITVSNDNGYSWSNPIDTGIIGQASNLMYLGGDMLLSIHSHRAGDVGLYVRLIDFKNDTWNVVEEEVIWGRAAGQDISKGIVEQFANLKFGQPSLLQLKNNELLATHWCAVEGAFKIKTHRLKINL